MISIEIDEDLREQSKLLLRKLKEKQTRLQQSFVSTSSDDYPSSFDVNTVQKDQPSERTKKSPVRRFGYKQDTNCKSNMTETVDESLQKSVSNTPSREVRAR